RGELSLQSAERWSDGVRGIKVTWNPEPNVAVPLRIRVQGYGTQSRPAASDGGDWQEFDPSKNGAFHKPGAAFLQMDTRRLAAPSYTLENPPRLQQDGGGLASVLSYLHSK